MEHKILVVSLGLLLPLTTLFILNVNIETTQDTIEVIEDTGHIVISDNSFIAVSPIYVPNTQTFASKVETQDINNQTLIGCLIECESGGDPNAEGDQDLVNIVVPETSKGILQFQRGTFYERCCDYLGYDRKDYLDPNIQIQCAKQLIENGEAWRWKNCMYNEDRYKELGVGLCQRFF